MQATIYYVMSKALQEFFALSANDCPTLVGCVVTMPTPSLAFTLEFCQLVIKCKTTVIWSVGQIIIARPLWISWRNSRQGPPQSLLPRRPTNRCQGRPVCLIVVFSMSDGRFWLLKTRPVPPLLWTYVRNNRRHKHGVSTRHRRVIAEMSVRKHDDLRINDSCVDCSVDSVVLLSLRLSLCSR